MRNTEIVLKPFDSEAREVPTSGHSERHETNTRSRSRGEHAPATAPRLPDILGQADKSCYIVLVSSADDSDRKEEGTTHITQVRNNIIEVLRLLKLIPSLLHRLLHHEILGDLRPQPVALFLPWSVTRANPTRTRTGRPTSTTI